MMTVIERLEITEVLNEELLIHPHIVISKTSDIGLCEARLIGEMLVNGDIYEFNTVMRIQCTKRVQKQTEEK